MPSYDVGLADLRVSRPPGSAPGVVLVTLDLPDRRNMMSAAMTASWGRVMAGLAADPAVRAVVVTGEGTAFCSGGDVSWIGAEPDATVDELRSRMLPFYRTWLSVRDLEVPPSRRSTGPRSAPGWRWRWPATCGTRPRTPRWACRSPRSGCTPGWPRPTCCRRWPGSRWPARCC